LNIDKLKEKGKFVVGLDDAFPPMGFKENGEIVGFDIDMAKAAAKKMGVEVEFKPVVWDTIIGDLDKGTIDMVWNGMSITPERQEKVLFTTPYMKNTQAIVVKADSAITKKADLNGKKVGYQAGSSAKKAFGREKALFDSCTKTEYAQNDLALVDLELGRVDAVVVDIIVAGYYMTKKPNIYKILDDNFGGEYFGVALRKTDFELLRALQTALDDMKADGTSAEISKKWFGEDIVQ
jgi:polar amino acid transport system substrate-binding protein